MIYFFLALVLFSRTRLNLLRSGWVWERIPIGTAWARAGSRYTRVVAGRRRARGAGAAHALFAGVAGHAGLFAELSLSPLIQTIFFVIVTLIYACSACSSPTLPRTSRRPPAADRLRRPARQRAAALLSEFVQSLIFWMVFLIIAGYVVAQYLRRHPEIVEWLKQLPGMSLLVRAWRKLRDGSAD